MTVCVCVVVVVVVFTSVLVCTDVYIYTHTVFVYCVSRDGRVASDQTGKRIRFYGAINTRSSRRNNRISFFVRVRLEDRMNAKKKKP